MLPVTSCADDSGLGTLRHVVLTAVSGDTVDLSALTCGTITLQSGAIHVDVDDLTVQGPGAAMLAIDGNAADRVFTHSGAGTLTIAGLTITHGAYAANKAWGGCLFSRGSLGLTDAVVSDCTVSGDTGALGGGVAAYNSVSLISSLVSGNTATQTSATPGAYAGAYGGGAVAGNYLDALYSTISGNEAIAVAGNAYGGGAVAVGFTQVKYSTLAGNTAITGATTDRILRDELTRGFATQVMIEAKEIGTRLGIPIGQEPEDRHATTLRLGAMKTSMLQDVEARKPVELDALVGAVCELGKLVGVPTPFTNALLGLARLHAQTLGL